MKKCLLLLLALCVGNLIYGQAQRMVFIEESTNASCGPCASQNPAFNRLLEANYDNVVALKYQWYFPGFDPMHEQNPGEANNRTAYYGINGVPTCAIDGTVPSGSYNGGGWTGYAGGPYGFNQTVIDNQLTRPTPLEMNLTHELNDDFTKISVNLVIKNLSTGDFTLQEGKVRIALYEKEIVFDRAPGSNGEREFYDVMRKMLPDASGTDMTTIAAGDSMVMSMTDVDIPDYVYNIGELGVVAWVQDDFSKSVFQAGRSAPNLVGFGDVGIEEINSQTTGICDNEYTPSFTIVNDGNTAIDSFDVQLLLDNEVLITESYVGSLEPDSELEFSGYDTQMLSPGTHTVELKVGFVNGKADYNPQNERSSFSVFGVVGDAIGEEVSEDFETSTANEWPSIAAVDSPLNPNDNGSNTFTVVDDTYSGAGGQDMGGYGDSKSSMVLAFFEWNTQGPDEMTMTLPKFDMSATVNNFIKFDRAGARRGLSQDRLIIEASLDCGEEWLEIFDEKGRTLATADDRFDDLYIPAPGDWVTDSVGLGEEFDNQAEVLIRFIAKTGNGNNHYIDNIQVGNQEPVNTNEAGELAGKVTIFPNPASDVANIQMDLVKSANVSVEIYDISGKLVSVLAENQSMIAGQHNLEWRNAPHAGVYTVRIKTDIGQVTQKLTIF